jgi:hypothetical protein
MQRTLLLYLLTVSCLPTAVGVSAADAERLGNLRGMIRSAFSSSTRLI